ncbi:hypothetical protein C4553_00255 [Candidatus Parcubacteria bacterium]|nr:MAG: hypothetical protein C4553_00255 [Candidatus Parcubacteria bacterium]
MSSLRQLKQQIKFSLNNLKAENSHHDFEAICRHFARKRLGLNIIPATGPVSAGGDQGRDFETYEILPEAVPELRGTRQVIDKKAAFACTTQAEGLLSKIKADVNKIITQGNRVDIVYFFSVQDLPVSERHDLQKWALETHKITLEVFDGEALSEDLTERDLFWVAQEYLHIPAELFPPVDNIDYLKLKEKWETRELSVPNYAEFDEIKSLARKSLFDKSLNQDIPFWLDKLAKFAAIKDISSEFKRKALYELIAIRMRGMRDMVGWEHYTHEYFAAHESFNHQVEAQEATVVLGYAFGASVRGAANFEESQLKTWIKLIEDYTDHELSKDYPVAIRAVLYELKGHQLLTNPYNRKIDEGLDWWLKLVDLIEQSPLFPLERFSDVLTVLIPLIGDHPKFEELKIKTDALIAQRIGGFAVADKCRDRAIEYRKNDELLKALREFHSAKINWFANETLYGSLLSMMIISETYFELGLLFAAKYYAMAVTFVASRSPDDKIKPFITRGLSQVAEIEYGNGEWGHFMEHADLSLRSLGVHSKTIEDPISEKIYEKTLFYSSMVYVFAKVLDGKKLFNYVADRVKKWNISELNDDLIPIAEKTWAEVKAENMLEKIKASLEGRPFNDVGSTRSVLWEACGISWKCSWNNTLRGCARAEHFISLVQIILADIADRDFYLLKTDAQIKFIFTDKFHIERVPTNDYVAWDIYLPTHNPDGRREIEEYHAQILSMAAAVIADLSLLPSEQTLEKIKDLYKQGLVSKALSGNSYEVLYIDLNPEELFNELISLPQLDYLQSMEIGNKPHKLLNWESSLLKGYSPKEEREKIENRYTRSILPIRKTIEKLKKDPKFQEMVKRLRSDGWKDWHILMSLGMIAVNFRVNKIGYKSFESMRELFVKEMNTEETNDSTPVPLEEFNEKALRLSLFMSMPSTLKIFGLEIKTQTPNSKALEHFLAKRLNYWNNDIEHKDILAVS